MIIPIDDEYRIRGTERCWQFEKLKVVKGQGEWRALSYFTSMDSALREAAQRELRVYPAKGIAEALAACNRVTEKYSKIFDSVGSPQERTKKELMRGSNAQIRPTDGATRE